MKRIFKFGIPAAIIAGLVALALVACMSPIDPSGSFYQPPEGMGFIRLKINSTLGRTIRPMNFDTSTILSYKVEIEDDNGDGVLIDGYATGIIPFADIASLNIDLDPDDAPFTLTITAYLDDVTTPVLDVASATVTFSVTANSYTEVPITLRPISPPTSGTLVDGTFEWEIEFLPAGTPHVPTPSNMIIKELDNNVLETIDLTDDSNWEDDTDLPEGYYWVDFEIGTSTPFFFRQVLHVYRRMTSKLEQDFTFTEDGTGIKFGSIPVTSYDYPPTFAVTFTGSGNGSGDGSINDQITLSLSDLGDTAVIAISNYTAVTTPYNPGYDGNMVWYCVDEDPMTDGVGANPATTFTVDMTNAPFEDPGNYILTVVGYVGTSPRIPHASYIYITIED